MKRILQIDGGGIKGLIPVIFLDLLQKDIKQPLHKYFDMISGTSTGSIIGGCLAAGVDISVIKEIYIKYNPILFTPRPFRFFKRNKAKYDRKVFIDYLKKVLDTHNNNNNSNIRLKDLQTDLMTTAFNLCSSRTHFFKSWSIKDQDMKLIDIIANSALSAAYYFGSIKDSNYEWTDNYIYPISRTFKGAIWQDGGQGTNNCTLEEVILEAVATGWVSMEPGGIEVLSLGCGTTNYIKPFNKVKTGIIKEAIKYPMQARIESTIEQIRRAIYIANLYDNIKVKRMDCFIPKEADKLDSIKHIYLYRLYGEALYTDFKRGVK